MGRARMTALPPGAEGVYRAPERELAAANSRPRPVAEQGRGLLDDPASELQRLTEPRQLKTNYSLPSRRASRRAGGAGISSSGPLTVSSRTRCRGRHVAPRRDYARRHLDRVPPVQLGDTLASGLNVTAGEHHDVSHQF